MEDYRRQLDEHKWMITEFLLGEGKPSSGTISGRGEYREGKEDFMVQSIQHKLSNTVEAVS